MSDERHKRAYLSGRMFEMTPEFKASVVPALKALDKTQTWLAGQIQWVDDEGVAHTGVDKSAITVMLRPATMTSRLVPEVCRILSLPLPVHGVDLGASDILDLASQLDEEGLETVKALMRQLAKRSGKSSDP